MLTLFSRALRSWYSAKGAALLAILALAIGIGAATAIYTLVYSLLLKHVAYRDGERFVALFSSNVKNPDSIGSETLTHLLEYKSQSHSFDMVGWFVFNNFNLTNPGEPQHVAGIEVTPTLALSLGIEPTQGRWFTEDAAESNVAVIAHSLWERLGGDRALLNKSITLNGKSYTVIGIMPPSFRLPHAGPRGPAVTEVWIPLDKTGRGRSEAFGGYFCYARLKPGVKIDEATGDVKRIAANIAKADPVNRRDYTVKLERLQDVFTDEFKPTLLLLFGGTGLLLLIACANVAGLLVARSVAKARETAIAVALGAGRLRLAAQYFVEGLVVSVAGAALGMALAYLILTVLLKAVGDQMPRSTEIGLDWTALLFALAAALFSSTLAGLAPLWQALRTQPNAVLSEGVRASAGRRTRWLSQALVAAEIALAFTLLTVGALSLSELRRVRQVSPGFDASNLMTFDLAADDLPNQAKKAKVQYIRSLIASLEGIPGVTDIGFVNQLPLNGCCYSTVLFTEAGESLSREDKISILMVNPNYWRTMRIPLRVGRLISEQDATLDSDKVAAPAVLGEVAAKRYFPNQDPLGKVVRLGGPKASRFQIVGVVGAVRNEGLAKNPTPEIYISGYDSIPSPLQFVVRAALPSTLLTGQIRQAIRSVNPTQPLDRFQTMETITRFSLAPNIAASIFMTLFAMAALLMASLGVYGLVSYAVDQRKVEIGTRLALGAEAGDVLRMVVGDGLKLSAFGIVLGGGLVAVTAQWLRSQLNIGQLDPLAFLWPVLITAMIVAAASFMPAWRATRLSPMIAIRGEQAAMFTNVFRPRAKLDERPTPPTAELLGEFADASRTAASYRDAIRTSLQTLCDKLGAGSAMLLERQADSLMSTASTNHLECRLPIDGLLASRLKFFPAALPITLEDLDAWRRWALENRPEVLLEIETLTRIEARLAVALRDKSGITGMLLLGAPTDRAAFSGDDRQVLRSCGEHFSLMIQNARLTTRVVEEEKMRRDLELAVEVQRRLLPQRVPQSPLTKLSGMSLPARSVGGDYYDFLELPGGRLGIAIADIAGKGIPAALVMSVVQASLRMIALEGNSTLPQLATKMNRYLYRSTGQNSYATFFYAQIDETTGQLHYVNAGHNPPYLLRASGEIEELPAGGTVIGLFPEMKYAEAVIKLNTGDVLIAFTDGVTEALNAADEEFGEDRLKELLRRVAHLSVDEITPRISEELKDWIGNAEQYDDLTFLLMKVG